MTNKINVSVTKEISNLITPGKKQKWLNFSICRNTKSVSNSSINLHPKGIGNGFKKYKAFSKETIDGVDAAMGYVSDFRNSGEEAIIIHGTKNGQVALYSHSVKNREEKDVKEFIIQIRKVHSTDISNKNNGPLHVISCFGVSNGVYQAFSDELMREVIGYGDGNVISTSGDLKDHFNKETSIINSVIGDVEKDRPEDLKLMDASIHKYIPHASKTKTSV